VGTNCSSKATEPKVFGEATVWHRVVRAIRAPCVHQAEMISELAIGTSHDQRAVGIEVGSEHDFRAACLPQGRCFCDLHDTAGRA